MAIKKSARKVGAARKAKAPRAKVMISVNMTVFGSQKVGLQLEAGSTMADVLGNEIPHGWQVSTMTMMVNDKEVANTHILNEGDLIAFVPKVTGGN